MAFTSLFFSLKSLVPLKSSSLSTCFLHALYFFFYTVLTANERRLLRPTTAASFSATHRRPHRHYRPTKFHDDHKFSTTTPLPPPPLLPTTTTTPTPLPNYHHKYSSTRCRSESTSCRLKIRTKQSAKKKYYSYPLKCSRASPTETGNTNNQQPRRGTREKREARRGEEKGEEIESASSREVKRMKEGFNEARKAYLFTNAGTGIRTSATGSLTTTE